MKSLWGAFPAFDVLNLKGNEGENWNEDVALCFAGKQSTDCPAELDNIDKSVDMRCCYILRNLLFSEFPVSYHRQYPNIKCFATLADFLQDANDLRNVVMSVLGMPADHKKICSYAINCKDLAMAARNVVILLISFLSPPEEAARLMLHVWYSARLTTQMVQLLNHIRRCIAEGVENRGSMSETDSADQMQSMQWKFDSRVLKLSLYKSQWDYVLKILEFSPSLEEAERRRRRVMLLETQLDTRDRQYYDLRPSKRVSIHRLRETGVLLPFGNGVNGSDHHIFGYQHPNP